MNGWRHILLAAVSLFPRDHFDHPAFRTEWWYYTGNLTARDGRHYGFELVFFRQAQRRGASDNASAWRVDDLYLAHLALTDIDGRRFRYFKRLNRAGPGIAGASLDDGRIWNGNWEAKWDKASDAQTLSAIEDGIRFTLHLTPRKPPVINSENYVTFPRLDVEGTLNGAQVSGTAWMDHQWFSNLLAASDQGWDWFSVQLDNHTELMLFQMRNRDGGIQPSSSGTYIAANGRAIHLKRVDFSLQPLEYWISPKTGARYPVKWRIAIPSLQVTLDCAAAVPGQELDSAPAYWEGAVRYSGSSAGVGYLEMTGYAGRVRLD